MYCVCLANLLRTSSENSDSLFSPKTILIWELTSPALDEASTVQVFFRKFDEERYVASPIKCLKAVISRPQEGYIVQCTWYTVELKPYIYIWLKRYIFKRKRLFAWSSTIQRFMVAVRAIALQLCRRSIIPTETFFQILHIYRDYRNNRQYYRLLFFFAQYCNITKRWRLNWVTNWVVFMIKWNWNYSGFIWTSLFLMAESDAAATRDY